MSTRKAIDMLGETHLPDDLFTNTDGLNWMMDTYPDLGQGLGVLDGQVLQESRQPPNLPDGVVTSGDVTFDALGDISDMVKEASLTDLSWLELAEQDPDRLPDNPVDNGIPELEEAWGIRRRTDGTTFQPNVDLEVASYEASLRANPQTKKATAACRDVVRSARRKVAAGMRFKDVAADVAQRLGEDAHLVRTAMLQLQAEAPLLGRVYVKASDYPGCASGHWAGEGAPPPQAAYVVQKNACTGCVHASEGRCAIFSKRIVASVPWEAARRRYAPSLEASGRKVASDLPPQEALVRAFQSAPRGYQPVMGERPTHVVPADQIGVEEARTAFAALPAWKRQIAGVSREQVVAHVGRWCKAGMLTTEQATRLTASKASPPDILHVAAQLAAASKSGAYSGGLNAGKMGYAADASTAMRELHAAEERSRKADAFIREEVARREAASSREGRRMAELTRRAAAVAKQIDLGLRGRALVAHITRSFAAEDQGIVATILDPIFVAKDALREPVRAAGAFTGIQNEDRVGTVTAKEAWAHLRAVHPPTPLDLEARRAHEEHRKLTATLGRWVRDGLLQKADADRLAASSAPRRDVLRVAAQLAGRGKVSTYSGIENNARVAAATTKEAWAQLAAAEGAHRQAGVRVEEEVARRVHAASRQGRRQAQIQKKAEQIFAQVGRGLRGAPLKKFIRKLVARDELAEVSKLVGPRLAETGALGEAPTPRRTYEGSKYQRAPVEITTPSRGPAYGEAERLLRWARQQMSEGFAGRDLTHLLETRFSAGVRTAAMPALQTLREAHEGLAGHLYVDAQAYASEAGTKGCEKGALRHRANQVPTVLQMPRCASCVLRRVLEDGTSTCGVYNKVLVASAPTEHPKAYQAEIVRLADGTDADRVASLFANAYDPNEYQLGVDGELDSLCVSDTPSNEEVGEVLFGGLEFE